MDNREITVALNNFFSSSDDDALETEAIHWLVRLTSGTVSDAELKSFARWRQRSQAHEQALSTSLKLWLQLGKPLEAQYQAILLQPSHSRVLTNMSFGLPTGRKLSALFLLLISLVGCYQWMNYWRFNYVTRLGELREVPLNDGSTMWLNTDSAANIEVTDGNRHVTLARGEAYFDVKQNEHHSFTVDAGQGHIKVMSTAFGVKIDGGNTVITVKHGKASVSDERLQTVTLDPNESATINPNASTISIKNVDAIQQLAWQKGLLIFENTTLRDIVQTLRRYDRRVIYLDSPSQEQLKLSTSININRVNDWYSLLEKVMPLRVTRMGPVIWIHDAPSVVH